MLNLAGKVNNPRHSYLLPARLVLLLIFTGLIIFNVSGQFPFIQKIRIPIPSGEPVFTKLIQDKDGYLWFGSSSGLYRFDGTSSRHYFPASDSTEFNITTLFESQDGVLWIGCKDGKIYRLENGRPELFSPEEGTAGEAVSDIAQDKEGVIWWSTAGEGVYYFAGNRVYNINHEDGLPEDYVYDLECDREGLIWAATDAGIAACSQNGGSKTIKPFPPEIILPDLIVRVISEDKKGKLWLGFEDGGVGYIPEGRSEFIRPYKAGDWVYGPVQDFIFLDDATWIATSAGELLAISAGVHGAGIKSVFRPEMENTGKISDMAEDREGNAWIVAHSGIYRTSGTKFLFLDPSINGRFHNIHALRNDLFTTNAIWFSNDEGLFFQNHEDNTAKQFLHCAGLPDLKVMCLFQDHLGYIWAGTFNYGVFRISPSDGSFIQVTEAGGLVNNNVLSISGHDDTLWMATLGGATELVLEGKAAQGPFSIRKHNHDNGLVNDFIYSVYEDGHDQVWFATDGDGISVKTSKGWITYGEKEGLLDDVVYSITGDKFGNIWIASASKGIFKFNEDKFTQFSVKEGLSSTDITGIATLDDELLIVHDNGLDILHIPSGRIAHYGEEIGLSEISPDLNVISKDKNGNAWIGTRSGIIRYRHAAGATSYGPQTVLEEMSVYLEPMPMKDKLVLGYQDNHVSFKYAGLWYSNPEKVSYQVMLEGYDLGWKDTYDRQATYSSLPPGKYTFRVRSSLDQSYRDASGAAFSFRIREPFWLSLWFIIPLIILLALGIYFIIRYREKRLRKIEEDKKEKVEFEFQVLKNQVNPHFLFNSFSTLMSLIEDQPDQALQYTEKLSDFFRTILQFKDQEVIKLDDEVSLVESYFFLMKKRYGDNINLDISLKKISKDSFIPPMTLQILIENAIKHNVISREKPLFIKIFEDEGKIVVENNLQPKMMVEVSTGIGLQNIRKRYRLITKEEPVMEMTEEVFRVKLPGIKG